jgi:5-methylthioadenosine/S-adenosylhomocysteine deaminase
MNILIKNTLLEGATQDIFLRDGAVESIGTSLHHPADRVINGSNKVALPSFINGHTHAAMTLFRGYADDIPLKRWLEEKIWVLEAKLTEEDVYWGTKLACLEMIRNGITVFNDMYWHFDGTARAVCDMGMRGIISAVLIDMFDRAKAEDQMALNSELYEKAKTYLPNVTFALGPHAVYTVSTDSLAWTRDFAEKNDLLIHMHVAETEGEATFGREKYGRSPVEILRDTGILSERFVGAHGCWLDESDCNILMEHGAKLVHNPVSNLKLSVGRLFPYRLVTEKEIPFCLGTDGCSSNNHLDMIETMKYASLLAKFSTGDPTFMPAKEALDRATVTGAEVFRLGEWKIAVGSRADIILVDLDRPEFVPNFDMKSDLVYSANGSAVDTVICMGRILMENRRVEGEETICREASRVARELVER